MSDAPNLTKVLFRVPEADGTAHVETLWATPLGNDRYRLDNSSFYAYSVSWKDVVLAPFDEQEGFPTFQRVVEKSGHRTIRVLFEGDPVQPGSESQTCLDRLVAMGCSYEGANRLYICVDIPPGVDLGKVRAFMIENKLVFEHADPTYDDLFPRE